MLVTELNKVHLRSSKAAVCQQNLDDAADSDDSDTDSDYSDDDAEDDETKVTNKLLVILFLLIL